MKQIKKIMFLMLFVFMFLFNSISVSATAPTDLDDIGNMFTFGEANVGGAEGGGDLLDTSMSFSVSEKEADESFWNIIFKEYHDAIIGVSGVCTLTFVLLFIYNFARLGATAGNPQERKKNVIGLLWTGIGACGSGATLLFVAIFMKLFE